ncbi:glycosyltransferase family 2 protein [Lysobacter sp. S4-A87]|uniref:glycosyltransferase family 2 protein n=1 Tax=Lysobacter sp. S4-A87 TaxID=2925843 RepID=UPI001F53A16D|nr:glycosyltransferase family 2 protein [Lysobacter sp. S4-A87]UNK51163.1 glycosyltransferase family 2 protein [Lysobacter sp. S4-A87]
MATRPARLTRDDLVVVIPALNEALRIREVVSGALAECPRVIVIDDGSDDGTGECIADLPATVLRHSVRMGKGASLRHGFAVALTMGARAIVTMDGDGQHLARDIPRLLASANRHPDHVVIGARLQRRSQQPLHRRLANGFADWGIAWGTGYGIADSQSGQRLYPAAVAALTDTPGEDFVFEAQILISAAQQLGTRCVSVPIESRYQSVHGDEQFRASHFKPLRDFSRITSHIVAGVFRRGSIPAMFRSIRANPPLIDDGEALLSRETAREALAAIDDATR